MDGYCRRNDSQEAVGREQGGGVAGICARNVHGDALDDGVNASAVEDDADNRNNPVDVRLRGPGEDEESDGKEKGCDDGGQEVLLWDDGAMFLERAVEDQADEEGVGGAADNACKDYADKYEACLRGTQAVHRRVDEGKGIEKGPVSAINQGHIKVCKSNSWVFEGDLDGSYQCFDRMLLGREVPLLDFTV